MKIQLARLVAKLLGNRNFTVQNGTMHIWTVPMVYTCAETLPYMYRESKDKRRFKEVMYYMGKLQSFNGTNVLIKRFGLKNNERTFLQLFLDQGEMLGIAKGEIEVKDPKMPHVFLRGKVSFALTYKKMYGLQEEGVCSYMAGILAGGVEAIFLSDKTLVAVETKCVAKGDDTCEFEIKPESMWKGDPLFVQQSIPEPGYYRQFKKVDDLGTWLTEKR